MKKKPIIAISGCLLGEEIRFDGQHKRHPHIVQELSQIFDYKSFCPEVAMGLGIPRPAIKLISKEDKIQLVDSKDITIDHTPKTKKVFKSIEKDISGVFGIVLTKGSPSCGYDPIKVYNARTGISDSKERGVWAKYISERNLLVPIIDSGRLYDDHLRDTFRTQVLSYFEFNQMEKNSKKLMKFHEQHKFYLYQYGAVHIKKLGKICAGITKINIEQTFSDYADYLFGHVYRKIKITDKNRTNTVEHMAGFFKDELSASDKRYLHDNIKAFRQGKLKFESLIVLVEFLTKSYEQKYIKNQKILKYYSKI